MMENGLDENSDDICLDDAAELVVQFSELMLAFEFEQARELVETSKRRSPRSSLWVTVMDALAGIARCDVVYFSLSFLVRKQQFLRRETILEKDYEDISKALDAEMERRTVEEENIFIESIVQNLYIYVSRRRELLRIYHQVLAEISEELIDKIVPTLENIQVSIENSLHSPLLGGLFSLMNEEVSILLGCFLTYNALTSCQILPSLTELKGLQRNIIKWTNRVEDLTMAIEKRRPSLLIRIFASSPTCSFPRLGIITWFTYFLHFLIAKFSIYFHDALLPHSVPGEIRFTFPQPHAGLNFYPLFQAFFKRTTPICIGLFLDYEDQSFPLGETRHHGGGMRNCKTCSHLLGPTGKKYAPLVRIGIPEHKKFFSDWFLLVEGMIKQARSRNLSKSSNSKRLKHKFDSATGTITYCALIERRIFFAAIYRAKNSQYNAKALIVEQFVGLVINSLNGSKVAAELKSVASR
ncbi:hypothetical protein L596_014848 [Steinernema carpocapsae]|uniref:Uncharacterized protein n=1 Tax=Steinernema carpocapsae TaxID=34508 RepID=A0A4U5NDZ9_STECR|nr:hypothetical protein L596_014848 [Steinernema carpocapsae]